jgi:hypothetical protein
VSTRTLEPGLFLEVQGWVLNNGSLRATDIQIKVQAGAMRMTGRIEQLVSRPEYTSMFVNGAEFRVDDRSAVVAQRNGLGVSGTIADLKVGNDVDITGSYISDTGTGVATSGLFHADRVIMSKTFRIQGVIRSRTPPEGIPTSLFVHGIGVTITPETTILSNGMNERNESFMPREEPLVIGIEDDAGDPCLNLPGTNACPDRPPQDPAAAGELQLGSFVRIEGILDDTGFSPRFTARAIQVEKPNQVRFQAIVESREGQALNVRLGESLRTRVVLDSATQMEGVVAAGRFVEITAQFNGDKSIHARRIKVLQ